VSRVDPLEELGLSLAAGAAELHVVRHADAVPESDDAFRIYDDYEQHPLSPRGRVQAERVAERFRDLGLAAVYSSPVRRARETAEAISIGPVDDAMPLRTRLAWLAMIAMRDGSWRGIPGTEDGAAVRARMLRALDAIAAEHPGRRVAVVSHAGAINAALGAIAGTAHDFLFPLANASVSVVRIGGGRRLLMSANETAHLHPAVARSAG